MKRFRILSVVLFTVCLFLTSVLSTAMIIAVSPSVYTAVLIDVGNVQLDRTGALSARLNNIGGQKHTTAILTDKQTKTVIRHISAYLFDFENTSDFSLTLQNVVINGETVPSASVFGPDAVHHMRDVKRLFHSILWLIPILLITLALLICYFIRQRHNIKTFLFRYSGYTYLGILSCFAVFFGGCGIDYWLQRATPYPPDFYSVLWKNMHYLFFPFNTEAVHTSFFNDALTSLLNVRFFIPIVGYCAITVLVITATQLIAFATLARRNTTR